MRVRSPGSAAMIVAALVVAACTSSTVTGGPPGSLASPSTAAASALAVPVTVPPDGTPGPGTASPSHLPGSPPRATLAIPPGGSSVPGDLGSYTWDGFASDGPWVVGTARSTATAGTELRVSLAEGPDPVSWTAAWAPVRGGSAGTPVAAGAGAGSRGIAVVVPAERGDWSLQVAASFGEGRQAVWYWHVAAVP